MKFKIFALALFATNCHASQIVMQRAKKQAQKAFREAIAVNEMLKRFSNKTANAIIAFAKPKIAFMAKQSPWVYPAGLFIVALAGVPATLYALGGLSLFKVAFDFTTPLVTAVVNTAIDVGGKIYEIPRQGLQNALQALGAPFAGARAVASYTIYILYVVVIIGVGRFVYLSYKERGEKTSLMENIRANLRRNVKKEASTQSKLTTTLVVVGVILAVLGGFSAWGAFAPPTEEEISERVNALGRPSVIFTPQEVDEDFSGILVHAKKPETPLLSPTFDDLPATSGGEVGFSGDGGAEPLVKNTLLDAQKQQIEETGNAFLLRKKEEAELEKKAREQAKIKKEKQRALQKIKEEESKKAQIALKKAREEAKIKKEKQRALQKIKEEESKKAQIALKKARQEQEARVAKRKKEEEAKIKQEKQRALHRKKKEEREALLFQSSDKTGDSSSEEEFFDPKKMRKNSISSFREAVKKPQDQPPFNAFFMPQTPEMAQRWGEVKEREKEEEEAQKKRQIQAQRAQWKRDNPAQFEHINDDGTFKKAKK